MRKFLIDFSGEEEYEEPEPLAYGGVPSPLFMVTFSKPESADTVHERIKHHGLLAYRVKYKKKLGDSPRFAVAFNRKSIGSRGAVDALNISGMNQFGHAYFFYVYYDDTISDEPPEYPPGLGRDHGYVKKSDLDYFEIVSITPGE